MAHFHIKKKKGRPYLYVREIARVQGKPKVVNQIYIGSPDRVASLIKGDGKSAPKRLRVEEFGSLWAALRMDSDVNLAKIVNEVVPRAKNESGPTVGDYFIYCVLNRMVESKSKHALPDWYSKTAIQQIRPVDTAELTSQRFWEKWDRVDENSLDRIARRFFKKIWESESPDADCLLFDTTNYYTFMASDTKSELARRGHNKAGRHNLRQVGLGLLVARQSRLPLYYRVYPGNTHDSHLFRDVLDDMFGVVCGLDRTKERLTVVIDKGMNAEDNYTWIDDHKRVHFVTTYSTYFAQELAMTPLAKFEPLDLDRNRRLTAKGKQADRLVAYRTKGEYWGKERAVVVTHNPVTARKKTYSLDAKLETLRTELLQMRSKVKDRAPQWRKADPIRERYLGLCERLHLPTNLYAIELTTTQGKLSMSIRKDAYQVERRRASFGRNIIITDNTDWTTADIVQSSLDRWEVEDRFRQSNDHDLVSTMPIRHWTDSKIRCHLFTCVVAMTYLRRLELRLHEAGIRLTAASAIENLRSLHSVLTIGDGRSKPDRRLETPTKTQVEVIKALGAEVDDGGVLHLSHA
jgi:transposase